METCSNFFLASLDKKKLEQGCYVGIHGVLGYGVAVTHCRKEQLRRW